MAHSIRIALAVITLSSSAAYAEDIDKGDAKALLASGLKLFSAKDYLGALSVFETAYERYPSPKILLNIGTTLLKLDRKVEAANIYQRYLDARDVDEKKQADAKQILAGLDKQLGVLDISVTPDNAEIQIGGGAWVGVDSARKVRVVPGEVTLLARAPRFKLRAEKLTISAGETRGVALALAAEPIATTETAAVSEGPSTGVVARFEPESRSKLAAMIAWHVDPLHSTDAFPVGSTVLVGASFDVLPNLSIQGGALLGAYFGPYVGGSFAFLKTGRVRPLVAVGFPILVTNGARISARGAAGAEIVLNRHLAFTLEVGIERFLNPEDDIMNETLFVPSLGITGRL